MIIMGVVLLFVLLVVALKVNKMVSKSMETVSTVAEYVLMPFTYLAGIFSKGSDDDEPVRGKVVKRK